MKALNQILTRLSALAVCSFLLTACDGSRAGRMIESGRSVYEDYEETGDPTWLIIFIVLGIIVGGLWIWKKIDKK